MTRPVIPVSPGPDRPVTTTAESPTDDLPTFCGTWPWPNSDLDLVLPADNAAVHRARGCCKGGSDD